MLRTILDWLGFGEHGHSHHGHGHAHGHSHGDDGHGHTHGVVDPTIATTGRGIWAIKWSFVFLAVTAALQMIVVAFSGSVALFADTIHNVGDAATAIPLWIAFMFARRKPSARFTYGLGRVEDLAGVIIVGIILFSALVAGYQAVDRLINPRAIDYLGWVAAAGVIGFLGNEIVAVFRIRVGREIDSAALIADGYHARVDGLTSIAVVFGAFGVWLGFPLADPIVGLIITVMIFGIVWQSARSVFTRMLDGIEPEMLAEIRHAGAHVPAIRGVENLRARWMGHRLFAEADILLAATATAGQARDAAESFRREAMSHLPVLQSLHVGIARDADAHRGARSSSTTHQHGHVHAGDASHHHAHGHEHHGSEAAHAHSRSHRHAQGHAHAHLESDTRLIETGHGRQVLELHHHDDWSRWRIIPQAGEPWRSEEVRLSIDRPDGRRQTFAFVDKGGFIESPDNVPKPHSFNACLTLDHGGHAHTVEFTFRHGESVTEPIRMA